MFYISWGKKIYQRTDGVAADFCPICRHASAVEVRQIRSQTHVYHIGMGQGDLVGHLCRCLTCGSEWPLQAGTITTTVNPSVPVSLETLIAETFPRLPLIHGERLEQEAIIRRDPFALPTETRLSLIAEPFFVLDNDLRRDENQPRWQNMVGGLGCLGSAGFAIAAVVAFTSHMAWWGILWAAVTVILAWQGGKLCTAATDQFMRKSIYPRLASCLALLHVSPEELTEVIHQIGSKSKCAEQTKAKHFLPVLEEAILNHQSANAPQAQAVFQRFDL